MSAWVFFKISLMLAMRLRPLDEEEIEPQPALWQLLVATAGALAYSFASIVWDQGASGYEVYCLQLLLFNSVLYFALRAILYPIKERSSFLLAALFLGLCFTNHLTSIFAVPALLILYLGRKGFSADSFKLLGLMLVLTLAPLPLYLYAPLRSSASFPFSGLGIPALNQGAVGSGWRNFFAALTGRGFKDSMFQSGSFTMQGRQFLQTLSTQFGFYVGLIPAAAGLAYLWRRRRAMFWFFAVLVCATLGWVLNYGIRDIDAYFLMPITALMLLLVCGVVGLRPRVSWLPFALCLLPVFSLVQNYQGENNSGSPIENEFVGAVAKQLEPNAVVCTDEWPIFTLAFLYLQKSEGLRPDISISIPSNYVIFEAYTQEDATMYPQAFKADTEEAVKLRTDQWAKVDKRTVSQDTLNYIHSTILDNFGLADLL